jgi:hypothetical protein
MDGLRTVARFGFLHIFTRGKPVAGNSYLWPCQPWLTTGVIPGLHRAFNSCRQMPKIPQWSQPESHTGSGVLVGGG